MKIRKGFVSNSSSSSFIVLFDKMPTSRNELKDILFPGYSWNDNVSDNDFYTPMSVVEVIETVFNDIQNQSEQLTDEYRPRKKLTPLQKIAEEIESDFINKVWHTKNKMTSSGYSYGPSRSHFDKYINDDDVNDIAQSRVDIEIKEEKIKREFGNFRHRVTDICPDFIPENFNYVGALEMNKLREIRDNKKVCLLNRTSDNHIRKAYSNYILRGGTQARKLFNEFVRLNAIQGREDKMRRRMYRDTGSKTKCLKYARAFMKDHKGKWIAFFDYGNECNNGAMETSNVFDSVEHFKVSHH